MNSEHCTYCGKKQPTGEMINPSYATLTDAIRAECEDHQDRPWELLSNIGNKPVYELGHVIGIQLKALGTYFEIFPEMPHAHMLHIRCLDDRVVTLSARTVSEVYVEWDPCPKNLSHRHHRVHAIDLIASWLEDEGVIVFG